ncbi:MAG: glutathione S-transferase family protein [Porticoccaceae bacterium]
MTYSLYAIPHSLYSGRARSYLIKNGISFQEFSSGHESFKAEILPEAKLATVPCLRTEDGQVIRDGAAIIEYFESRNGRPCQPKTPQQRVVSGLFDLIGAEGLLRPAMHYRWNFPEENLAFLHYHFYNAQREHPDREAKTQYMMDKMRYAAMIFGVNDDSIDLVETLYMEFLLALDKHFQQYPYLLGWKPCIGDFGLLAPLYAHLGRDPKPLRIMQQQALHVYRWVERMNRVHQDASEYYQAGSDYLADDQVPETLLAVLRVIAEDLVPETLAAAHSINDWLTENSVPSGERASRYLGKNDSKCRFVVRGQSLETGAQPYRFFQLQQVQDFYQTCADQDRAAIESLLQSCGLEALLTTRLDRRIEQRDNLEVWV